VEDDETDGELCCEAVWAGEADPESALMMRIIVVRSRQRIPSRAIGWRILSAGDNMKASALATGREYSTLECGCC
jgi:hypothetical protein